MNETDPTRRDDDTELGGAEDQELDSTDLDFIADDSAPSTAGFDDPEISFGQWLHQITTGQESDTMLRFAPTTANSLEITHSHPSGLTQFLTKRRTRLSTLMRDQPGQNSARATATAMISKIDELAEDRGINVGFVAAGIATWRISDGGASHQMSAPVLLAPVRLSQRNGREDFDVQLTGQAILNPALARYFHSVYGVELDPEQFRRAAYATNKLEPLPALELMREYSSEVRGLVVEHRILLSTFADLTDESVSAITGFDHPVLRDLYRAQAGTEFATELVEPEESSLEAVDLTPLDQRDPADEPLVFDLDPSQQTAVDLIRSGHSVVVTAPPGTGETQTALAAAAALAADGRRVLMVAERTTTLNELYRRADAVGLASMLFHVSATHTSAQLREEMIQALLRVEAAKEPATQRVNQTLVQRRDQLVAHAESLHRVRERWNCSPYQAMRALAELTALDPPPCTSVRLKRSVLDSTVARDDIAEKLTSAARLGAFSRAATESPWYGARLRNVQEAEAAYQLAEDINDHLPRVRKLMVQATEDAHLRTGTNINEWNDQVSLLQSVRGSLDHFTPDIFDRPVTDLIAATGSGSWRRDHEIEMSAMTRSKLRRVAKEYVRPGVSVPDLHDALEKVQEQLTAWNQYSTSKRHPKIPTGLDTLERELSVLTDNISQLQERLATPAVRAEELARLSINDLSDVVQRLVDDAETLQTLPERTLVVDQLTEHGLGELLRDFSEREVTADNVVAELEMAWWQSVLEAMLSSDETLTVMDGDELNTLEAEYRLADGTHLDLGASSLNWALAQRWYEVCDTHETAASTLRTMLKEGETTLENLADIDPELLQPLIPVWMSSPMALAQAPQKLHFDAVLILDAGSLALPTGLGAMARAQQVVAFGDPVSERPQPFHVCVEPTTGSEPAVTESVCVALRRVLPTTALSTMHRGVSQALVRLLGTQLYDGQLDKMATAAEITGAYTSRGAEVEYLTAPGTPGYGDDGVESTTAEVNRVVDLVFEQFQTFPHRSVAVLTTTPLHARRVAEAIRVNLADHRWATSFFNAETAPHGEPFVVAPLERAGSMVRDTVIFSLGYGRTSHGTVVHHFGPLSEQHGVEYYARLATRARESFRVLSCIHPQEVDPARLSAGAGYFWEMIELISAPRTDTEAVAGGVTKSTTDPLVQPIAEELLARGARVITDGASHADLLIWNPDPEIYRPTPGGEDYTVPLAVTTDGSSHYQHLSVRERSRLRPLAAQRAGWRPVSVWSIDSFAEPQKTVDRLGDLIGLQPGTMDQQKQRTRRSSRSHRKEPDTNDVTEQ